MSLHFDLSAVVFMITLILYVFGKNIIEITLYPNAPQKNILNRNFMKLYLCCVRGSDIFSYYFKCWFHNPIAS